METLETGIVTGPGGSSCGPQDTIKLAASMTAEKTDKRLKDFFISARNTFLLIGDLVFLILGLTSLRDDYRRGGWFPLDGGTGPRCG